MSSTAPSSPFYPSSVWDKNPITKNSSPVSPHLIFVEPSLSLILSHSLSQYLSVSHSPRLPSLLYPKCIESLLVWNLNFSIPLTIFISFSYLMNSNLSLTFPWLYHWLIIPAPKIETSELTTNQSVGFTILFRQELLMTVDVSFLKKKRKKS